MQYMPLHSDKKLALVINHSQTEKTLVINYELMAPHNSTQLRKKPPKNNAQWEGMQEKRHLTAEIINESPSASMRVETQAWLRGNSLRRRSRDTRDEQLIATATSCE